MNYGRRRKNRWGQSKIAWNKVGFYQFESQSRFWFYRCKSGVGPTETEHWVLTLCKLSDSIGREKYYAGRSERIVRPRQQDDKNQEIEKNFRYFQTVLPDLVKDHQGRYVLLRHEEIVGIYDTVHDAQMAGEKFYSDNLFSVQKVETRPIELGIFSHAVSLG